jgi:hypothetical protein
MALPNINIQLGNGGLGLVIPTNDALSGMILQGPAPASLALLEPKLITSLQDAVDLGITADYDSSNSTRAYKAIKEFYDGAGSGAQLWIMVVSNALNMETIMDVSEANYAVKLLDAAGGGIRMLTVVRDPAVGYVPTIVDGIDDDVLKAATKAQALALAYTAKYKPLRVILPAHEYDGGAGGLPDLKLLTHNRVAVLLGDTVTGDKTAVGVLLGRLASDPVQRNPGRVKTGSLPIIAAFLDDETLEDADGDVAVIDGKGFITFRRHVGLAGYYFTNDHTATGATDDYRSLARGRIIDKAIFLAYTVYLNELLDEIRVDATTGRIERAQAKYLQQICESQINAAMTSNDEIISVAVFVDANQNVLSTGMICAELRIVPFGYAEEIKIDLGFTNPSLN